jgi:hypothetical protein
MIDPGALAQRRPRELALAQLRERFGYARDLPGIRPVHQLNVRKRCKRTRALCHRLRAMQWWLSPRPDAGPVVSWGGHLLLVCVYAVAIVFFHFLAGWVHATPITSL